MPKALLAVLLSVALLAPEMTAAGRGIARPVTGPTSNVTEQVQVAYAGDRFLAVWDEHMGDLGRPLMGMLYDDGGFRISPLAFPVLPFAGHIQHLIGAGEEFALFWANGERTFLTAGSTSSW